MTPAEHTCAVARVYAQADGCEGGELLNWLADAAEYATDGHGYSYAAGSQTQDKIVEALRIEIAAHKNQVFGPRAEEMGYEAEAVAWVRAELDKLAIAARRRCGRSP